MALTAFLKLELPYMLITALTAFLKLHNKSVYCNPLDPTVCVGVSLGVWLCFEQDGFQDSEKILVRGDAKVRSAAHR